MHLPQGAAANLQQAFERSLTVYTGQILLNHSLAEAVYTANDAYPTTSRPHPPAADNSDTHGPIPDMPLGQAATISGSVQSGLTLSITLKVHNTSGPSREAQAMGPAPGGHFQGAFPGMGKGSGDAHQTSGVDPRAMTPGSGPQDEPNPRHTSRAMGPASKDHPPGALPDMGIGAPDANQTGSVDPRAMTPGSGPQNEGNPNYPSKGSAESVPDGSGATGAMGPSLGSQGSHDGILPAGPPTTAQGMMGDQPGSMHPSMDGSAVHAMAPSHQDVQMPGNGAGMP